MPTKKQIKPKWEYKPPTNGQKVRLREEMQRVLTTDKIWKALTKTGGTLPALMLEAVSLESRLGNYTPRVSGDVLIFGFLLEVPVIGHKIKIECNVSKEKWAKWQYE